MHQPSQSSRFVRTEVHPGGGSTAAANTMSALQGPAKALGVELQQVPVGNANDLDGALRRLATHSWGVLVVVIVGIGFAAYGIFCLTTFTHRRLEAP